MPPLVHFESISANFIVSSLWLTILIELSLGPVSGDRAFAYSFNEVVYRRIVMMRSFSKAGCSKGEDQFGIDLYRSHECLYVETNGRSRGYCHASSPIYISSGLVKSMQGMMCWIVDASSILFFFSGSNALVALTYLPPKGFRWVQWTGWIMGWCKRLHMQYHSRVMDDVQLS